MTPLPELVPLMNLDGIKAFSTRRGAGALPDSPYSGFSICTYTGDTPLHTGRCLDALATWAGTEADAIVMPVQTHSACCAVIAPSGPLPDLQGVDALVTRRRHTIIGINTADCLPLVMADPVARVIAVAHAGWRGAVGGVVENTLLAMTAEGANPADIHAAFGPHICPDCFEVGTEVAQKFPERAVLTKPEWPRPHVNLAGHVRSVLMAGGVSGDNIAPRTAALCSRCNPATFFSARRLGVSSGRTFTFVYLD